MANDKFYHSCTFFGSPGLEEWPYFESCLCCQFFGMLMNKITFYKSKQCIYAYLNPGAANLFVPFFIQLKFANVISRFK